MIWLALLLQAATPGANETVTVTAPPKPFAQTPATMVVEPVAMMIATLDADGDGKTSREEMEAGVKRSFEAIDTAHQGSLTATRCPARSMSTRTMTTASPCPNCRRISRACSRASIATVTARSAGPRP